MSSNVFTSCVAFLEKKKSRYALPTDPTRSGKPYPTPPRRANALETDALSLITSRVTAAISKYIGSLTQLIHHRVKEHLNNENVSVKKHIYSCQNKDYKGIDGKIIMTENDPANLRLYEEFYIRKCKPTLSSQEECSEFADLVF